MNSAPAVAEAATNESLRFLRAVCHLPNGQSPRLLVAGLSLGSVFVVSMRPPAIGSKVSIELQAPSGEFLPCIESWVAAVSMDPSDATRCGFELLYVDPDEDVLERLAELIVIPRNAPDVQLSLGARNALERRLKPRVDVDMRAQLELPSGALSVRVRDLSMSGAGLLTSDEGLLALPIGTHGPMTMFSSAPECVTVEVRVVRKHYSDEDVGVGVQFIEMADDAALRLEGLILEAVMAEQL
ncbi:MAG: PilZ domain-containing protein [Deltaproteobacteria bacterium]